MESDQIITALKSLLSAAEREFDTKRCRHSSLKALFAARKVLRSVAAAPAVPTDAEVEDAIESFEDATHIEARHGVGAALFKEFNAIKIAARDALRALIARRVAAAEKELDEARAELAKVLKREADGVALFDELLARERAEVAQLKEKLTRWDIDYDRVHKEAKDLRAEVERLRAAAKDAAPAKETP